MWDLGHSPWIETVELEELRHPSEQYFLILSTGLSLLSGFWFTQTTQQHSEKWPLWNKNNGLYLYQTTTNIYTLSLLQLSECKDKIHNLLLVFSQFIAASCSWNAFIYHYWRRFPAAVKHPIPKDASQYTCQNTHHTSMSLCNMCFECKNVLLWEKKNQCKRNGIHCVSFCQLLVFPFSYRASCKHRFDKHIFNKAQSRTSQCSVTAKGYNSKAKKPKQTDTVINNV